MLGLRQPLARLLTLLLLGACDETDGPPPDPVVHVCATDVPAGSPCDFLGSCTLYSDYYQRLCGTLTVACVDGTTQVDDQTYYCVYPGSACPEVFAARPVPHLDVALEFTPSDQGRNLDGLNNSPATGGRNVAGCGVEDPANGADVGFSSMLASLSPAARSTLLAGPEGVRMQLFGRDVTAAECGRLVFEGEDPPRSFDFSCVAGSCGFVGPFSGDPFDPRPVGDVLVLPVPDANACDPEGCNAAPLVVSLRTVRFNVQFTPDGTGVVGGLLAGAWFVGDCVDGMLATDGTCGDGTFAEMNAHSLWTRYGEYADAANLSPSVVDEVRTATAAFTDLRLDENGWLTPCTGALNTQAKETANALGVSFSFAPVVP